MLKLYFREQSHKQCDSYFVQQKYYFCFVRSVYIRERMRKSFSIYLSSSSTTYQIIFIYGNTEHLLLEIFILMLLKFLFGFKTLFKARLRKLKIDHQENSKI